VLVIDGAPIGQKWILCLGHGQSRSYGLRRRASESGFGSNWHPKAVNSCDRDLAGHGHDDV